MKGRLDLFPLNVVRIARSWLMNVLKNAQKDPIMSATIVLTIALLLIGIAVALAGNTA